MSIRGRLADTQLYGPTGYATPSFPAGVMLTAAQWAQWQQEATAQNAAQQAPLLAAAYQSIATSSSAIPTAATAPSAGLSLSSIPTWGYWAAGVGAVLLLFRK